MASLQNQLVRWVLRLTRPRNSRLSVSAFRREFESLMVKLCPVAKRTNVETIAFDHFHAELLSVGVPEPRRGLLHLHGGSFVFGSAKTHRGFVSQLCAATGTKAFVPDYRLAPEATFPLALDDAMTAYKCLAALLGSEGCIVISADSAGASLALQLVTHLRSGGGPMPVGLVLISPWIDLTCSGPSHEENRRRDTMLDRSKLIEWAQMYCGEIAIDDDRVSPGQIDFDSFPPTWIGVSGDELLKSDAEMLFARMIKHNVDVTLHAEPRVPHVWPLFYRLLPEGRDAICRIGAFVDQCFASRTRENSGE